MPTNKEKKTVLLLKKRLELIQRSAIENGLDSVLLKEYDIIINRSQKNVSKNKIILNFVVIIVIAWVISVSTVRTILGTRCLLPSNYFVWEATRPLANCSYCENVTKPIILRNVSKNEFSAYAYSPRPIIVKSAIQDWPATKLFSFNMFKNIYEDTPGSYETFDEGCQFLNFKTDLFTLKDVFHMPEDRVKNKPGQKPWYVGWANCHPDILAKVRQNYKMPKFLPEDAEYPAVENIFLGYEIGAVMHLDYITRLMWQGQVRGSKVWTVVPVPECEHICQGFDYFVEQGDIVLLDTRIWYHATKIPKGDFSITVQSEYG